MWLTREKDARYRLWTEQTETKFKWRGFIYRCIAREQKYPLGGVYMEEGQPLANDTLSYHDVRFEYMLNGFLAKAVDTCK